MSVTLRHTSTAAPVRRSTRAATSAHTKVAAWPTWVVSYGVIPHTYIRACPSTGSGEPPMRNDGAGPSPACAVIVLAAVFEPAGETVDFNSDDDPGPTSPVTRCWTMALSSPSAPRLRPFANGVTRPSSGWGRARALAGGPATSPACPFWP